MMKFTALVSIISLIFSHLLQAQTISPVVELQTNLGSITVELDVENAPVTVKNFLQYAEDGFYDGMIFHRVIPNYMAQGGGYTSKYKNKEATYPAIQNEAGNGLKNLKGTIAMVRQADPHTAKNQFYINLSDNEALDYTSSTPRGWGYAVFGEVTDGMDVLDAIQEIPTGAGGPFKKYLPQQSVIIKETVIHSGSAAEIVLNASDDTAEFVDEEPDEFIEDSVDAVVAGEDIDEEEDAANVAEEDTPAVAEAPATTIDLSNFEPEPPDVPAVE